MDNRGAQSVRCGAAGRRRSVRAGSTGRHDGDAAASWPRFGRAGPGQAEAQGHRPRRRRRVGWLPLRLRLLRGQRSRRCDRQAVQADPDDPGVRRRDRAARLRAGRLPRRPGGRPHRPHQNHGGRGRAVPGQFAGRRPRVRRRRLHGVAGDRRPRHRSRLCRRADLHRRGRAGGRARSPRLPAAARDHVGHLRGAALGRTARQVQRHVRRQRPVAVRPAGLALDVPRRRGPLRRVRPGRPAAARVAPLPPREARRAGRPRRAAADHPGRGRGRRGA